MSKHLFAKPSALPGYLVVTGILTLILVLLINVPGDRPASRLREPKVSTTNIVAQSGATSPSKQLSGAAARKYLNETVEGQSLMQAVTAARFGLEQKDRGPFGEPGTGYLGMSHEQNLNAWFAEDGVTVRPTVAAAEREQAWSVKLRLKAFGYGNELEAAPPIVSHQVKSNRIEYERGKFGLRNANFEVKNNSHFISESAIRNPQVVEWYENRSEGIEQGFTIAERPAGSGLASAEAPLRLVVSLEGDLHARMTDDGRAVELSDRQGKRVISYSQLTAIDADGKQLAAHLEVGRDGHEMVLAVDDRGAAYPIVIDPVMASLEKILDSPILIQTGGQFGDAVAIDGDTAAVGAWLNDSSSFVDPGTVYVFGRSGTTWSLVNSVTGDQSGSKCGYSVAISGTRVVYGCAGANSNAGRVWLFDPTILQLKDLPVGFTQNPGDLCGASVAISGLNVVLGCPGVNSSNGKASLVQLAPDNSGHFKFSSAGAGAGARNGTGVAIDGQTFIFGAPGLGAGSADVWTLNEEGPPSMRTIHPSDGTTGDLFGESVALSGNTAVISAAGNDEKGTDAGAAYVFARDTNGQWNQQQKLTASDAAAGDLFSYFAVAIQHNTIVVGGRRSDAGFANPNDNRGAAYVFMRNGTVWTEQRRIRVATFDGAAPGNEFGTSVAISGNTVLVGAEHAPATNGTANTGAAYVYRLDCTPPFGLSSESNTEIDPTTRVDRVACPGQQVFFKITATANQPTPLSYKWRKNGVEIPGATDLVYPLNNVSAADAGSFDAIVSNSCGSEISSAATLAIHAFTLSPNQNFSASGSPGIVNVTSTGSCGWTALSNSAFITISSGQNGTAPGSVGFNVAANTGPNQRTGTISIGDKTFTVTQDGLNCSYSIAPTAANFSSGNNSGSVNVTATAGCAWTAVSNDNWLTITSGSSGTGNGVMNYSVAANNGPARTGTLTVAGQTVTVTQANGCAYAIAPGSQNFPASLAAGAVNVTTANGCTWIATSNAAFINVTSGANGSGNGIVGYSITANDTTSQRSGTITIAGQTFTVMQDGAAPTPTPTPTPIPTPTATPTPSQTPSPTPTTTPTATPTPTPSPSPMPTPVPNVVQFGASNFSVQEDCTFVTITVNRIGDTSGAASVDYNTSDITATERKDYVTALGSLRFAAGETSKSFAVLINEDSFVEGNESFSIALSNPSGLALGGPAIATVTITDDAAETAANPIDDAQNYVCQHYHDFLNRQPDAPGLAFWTNQITACGSDQACIETRRINVSASFFLSIEFQDTGYLIERIYKAAYGDATSNSTFPSAHQLSAPVVRLNEFLSDSQEIGQGVIVGQGNWQQQIDNNKQALTTAFVQRSRFTTALPGSMTAAQFVDKLNANAGNPLSPAERNQLVNDLTTNAKTRAQVLRAVAEDSDLNTAESNRAFVLDAVLWLPAPQSQRPAGLRPHGL